MYLDIRPKKIYEYLKCVFSDSQVKEIILVAKLHMRYPSIVDLEEALRLGATQENIQNVIDKGLAIKVAKDSYMFANPLTSNSERERRKQKSNDDFMGRNAPPFCN